VFLQVTSEPSTAGGEDEEANVPGGRRARRRARRAGSTQAGSVSGRARS